VRCTATRIEELVTQLKQLNQRLTALEGQLLRTAGLQGPAMSSEELPWPGLDPNWLEKVSSSPQGLRPSSPGIPTSQRRAQIAVVATDQACRSASSAAST
jgi:RNA polymerase primary sigma factor